MDTGQAAEDLTYVALRRLQNRYADIVTRRAWTELAEIVRDDCPVVVDVRHTQFEMTGPTELGEFIDRQIQRFDLFHFVILNTVMRIDVAAGTAGARMYINEIRQNRSDGKRTDAYGVYHDRFERDGGGRWWFATRHYQSLARTAEPRANHDQHDPHSQDDAQLPARTAEPRANRDYDVFNPTTIPLDEI